MKIYLKRSRANVDAVAEYDEETGAVTVLKGSTVSETIAYSEKFRGAKSIAKSREGTLDGNKVTKDITFKSASTAANFVTGASTNGLLTWKDNEGKSLKQYLLEAGGQNE